MTREQWTNQRKRAGVRTGRPRLLVAIARFATGALPSPIVDSTNFRLAPRAFLGLFKLIEPCFLAFASAISIRWASFKAFFSVALSVRSFALRAFSIWASARFLRLSS